MMYVCARARGRARAHLAVLATLAQSEVLLRRRERQREQLLRLLALIHESHRARLGVVQRDRPAERIDDRRLVDAEHAVLHAP
eukprot:5543614-Prymnesium_polylepis.1